MNPNGQANVYWVLPHYMAVNCYLNHQVVLAQNQELRHEIGRINNDHALVMQHLGRAQEREHLWRQQARLLQGEIHRLREHIQGEGMRRLTDEQKEVLRQLLSQIEPLPVQQWLLSPHPDLTPNDDLFQAVIDRKQFHRLIKLYEDVCGVV
jgi:hypothetical protein